jgi:methionyl-tRNA synthetase
VSETPAGKLSFEDFKKVQLRTAKVLQVADHPNADRLYVLQIDLGTEQRQIVAGLRGRVAREKLEGSTIIVAVNLAPAVLRGVESNGMLLAATDAAEAGRVVALTTAEPVAPGSPIS